MLSYFTTTTLKSSKMLARVNPGQHLLYFFIYRKRKWEY